MHSSQHAPTPSRRKKTFWAFAAFTLAYALTGLITLAQTATPASNSSEVSGAPEQAGEKTITLDRITVTSATRSGKEIDHIPGSVNLITTEDISQQLMISQDPTTVLALTIPGYSPSRQSLNSGGETLRGRNPLILLDGIPQSTPLREAFREGYIADQSVIDRIEVINGPSATEGLGASGGIINFITKTPKKMGNQTVVDVSITSDLDSNTMGWRGDLSFAHKEAAFDLFVSLADVSRAMDHDARNRLLGVEVNGSAQDSVSHSVFLKYGRNFGADKVQRVEFTLNRFDLIANGNYHEVDGNRSIGLPTTAGRGAPPGIPPSNTMNAMSLEWTDGALGGGSLAVQAYKNHENIVFGAQNVASFQDPLIAPLGTFYDQSATIANKYGARTIWNRPDLLIPGFQLSVGFDYLHDETRQDLILTSRTFVPNLKFSSESFFAQLEYEKGGLTIRGGVRKESAQLVVDTFQGRYAVNRVVVTGGTLKYQQAIPNIGAVYRLPHGVSIDVAYSEGYSVPDVGTILRNVNKAGQSVETIAELSPIIAKNTEVGINWHGSKASIGGSVYRSTSEDGANIVLVNGITQLTRQPIYITGWELSAEYKPVKSLSLSAIYSQIHGLTSAVSGGPVDLDLSAINQGPRKLVLTADWNYSKKGVLRFGVQKYFPRNVNIGRVGFEEHFSGYNLFHCSTSYNTKLGRISLGIENLFNEYYINYVSESAINQQTNALYMAGRGRTFTLSDTLTF